MAAGTTKSSTARSHLLAIRALLPVRPRLLFGSLVWTLNHVGFAEQSRVVDERANVEVLKLSLVRYSEGECEHDR